MYEITYKMTTEDLAAYQHAVRDRIGGVAPQKWWEYLFVRWLALVAATAIVITLASLLIEHAAGRPMEFIDFFVGVLIGVAAMAAVLWVTFGDHIRRMARPDGPILDRHTLRLNNDGVTIATKHTDVRYAWAAFEEVADTRGLIILWIEPGAGVVIPGHAFETDATRSQFLLAIEAKRSASGLPRVGSFA